MTSREVVARRSTGSDGQDLVPFLPWLDEDTIVRGYQFERVAKWFLVNDATQSRQFRQVWLWSEWEHRDGPDTGVDLVALDRNGEWWAVQAKCFARHRVIAKSDIDTFIAKSTALKERGLVQHRMVIATTNRLSSHARVLLEELDVVCVLRRSLEFSTVRWPESESELRSELVTARLSLEPVSSPRPHQIEAVDAVCDELRGLPSLHAAQLVMACGTGKTLTSLWIKERLYGAGHRDGAGLTAVLVPSLTLLSQTLHAWADNASTDWRFLAVCSDESVAGGKGRVAERLKDLDVRATTSLDVIESFLIDESAERVVFCTYHSSGVLAEAAQRVGAVFDLTVCDEAHQLAGRAGKRGAEVLDDDSFPSYRRLFMTATPKRLSLASRNAAERAGVEVISMNDHRTFGPVVHNLSFAESIDRGLLTDFQVLVSVITDREALAYLDRSTRVEVDGHRVDLDMVAAQIAVLKAAAAYGIRRMISYHSSIRRAQDFAAGLLAVDEFLQRPLGDLVVDHINGTMSAAERSEALHRLGSTSGTALVSNAQCLTEGVDVPTLDAVVFVDARRSAVDIIQAIGRAIRLSPDKRIGNVIIPIVLPSTEEADRVLDSKGFTRLREVLWALRSHDPEFAVEIDRLRIEVERFDVDELPEVGLPDRIVIEHLAGVDVDRIAKKMRIEILESGSDGWSNRLMEAVAFREQHGHWPIKVRNDANQSLANWVGEQRKLGRRFLDGDTTAMPVERFERLNTTPGWEWQIGPRRDYSNSIEGREAHWQQRLSEAVAFHEQHGRWPRGRRDAETHGALATWVSYQQRQGRSYLRGEPSLMTAARFEQLAELPGWSWVDGLGPTVGSQADADSGPSSKVDRWQRRLVEAVAFREQYGRWPVIGDRSDPAVARLASWVYSQRYRGRAYLAGDKTAMPSEWFEQLEQTPGWQWGSSRPEVHRSENWSKHDRWELRFAEAVAFREQHGHWPMKVRNEANQSLANWVGEQRKLGRRFLDGDTTAMPAERFERLDTTPGWEWQVGKRRDYSNSIEGREALWQQRLSEAVAFHEQHGRWPRGKRDAETHGALATWVGYQQRQGRSYLRGEPSLMTAARFEQLDQTPGWRWGQEPASSEGRLRLRRDGSLLKEERWEMRLAEAVAFREQHGHWPMKVRNDANQSLANWVGEQRKLGRRFLDGDTTAMPVERFERLDTTPGWEWQVAKRRGYNYSIEGREALWQQRLSEAVAFHEQHGRWPRGKRDAETHGALATWVGYQQRQGHLYLRGEPSLMTAARFEQLDQTPGWKWSTEGGL